MPRFSPRSSRLEAVLERNRAHHLRRAVSLSLSFSVSLTGFTLGIRGNFEEQSCRIPAEKKVAAERRKRYMSVSRRGRDVEAARKTDSPRRFITTSRTGNAAIFYSPHDHRRMIGRNRTSFRQGEKNAAGARETVRFLRNYRQERHWTGAKRLRRSFFRQRRVTIFQGGIRRRTSCRKRAA